MILSVKDIAFKYNKKQDILTGAGFEACSGDIIAFIGKNGCGKTTLIKLIGGFLFPDSGEITVKEKEREDVPVMAGIIETPKFFNDMTGRENLEYYLEGQYNKEKVEEALLLWGLLEYADVPVRKYSLGMRQKLGLLLAFESEAPLLLFDEPTSSLDLQSIEIFYSQVKRAGKEGRIVILVTHIMYELEKNCTCIYEIKDGKLERKLSLGISDQIYEIVFESESYAQKATEILHKDEIRGWFGRQIFVSTEKNSISEIIRKTAGCNIVSVQLRNMSEETEADK